MSLASFFANKCFEYLLKVDDGFSEQDGQEKERSKNRIFPPWASEPIRFQEVCTGCEECVSVCEQDVLVLGEDGLPCVDFSNGFCTFCGDCARSCPETALSFSPDHPPWQLQLSITHDCLMEKNVLCQVCQEQCDQRAIIFPQMGQDLQQPQIVHDRCNGCGACFARCPVDALSFQYDARQSEAVQRGEK